VRFRARHTPTSDKRFEGIHDEEAAIGAEERTAAQIHEVAGPAAARVVSALDGSEKLA